MSNEAVVQTDEQGEGYINNGFEEKKEYLEQREEKKEENPLLNHDEDAELIANLQKEDLEQIYSRLKSVGLSTRHLRSIEPQDLQDLCNTLELTLVQRIKFKSIVHDIKQKSHSIYLPSKSIKTHIKNEQRPIVSNIERKKGQKYDYDYLMKVLIIGDSGVGKSSLLLKYADWTFEESYISTIGVDFRIKNIKIDDDVIKMQLWDTAGQERFRSITCSYYRGTHAIISCYDITDRSSFRNCKNGWIKDIEQYANPDVFVMITGCKRDLEDDRKVSYAEGKQFAESIGDNARFCEVSAKTGVNVNGLFNTVAIATLNTLKAKQPVIPQVNRQQNANINNEEQGSWWDFAVSTACCTTN